MSNSWVKIIFHLNFVFLLTANPIDESVNKENLLNTAKGRINSELYDVYNELYKNRYLIGNCTFENANLDMFNTKLAFTEIDLHNLNEHNVIDWEQKELDLLDFLNLTLHLTNSCQNKNQISDDHDEKIVKPMKNLLLNKTDQLSANLSFAVCRSPNEDINNKTTNKSSVCLQLIEMYSNTLDYFQKNFENIIYCSVYNIYGIKRFLESIEKFLSDYATNDNETNISIYEEIKEEYESFKRNFQYIDDCQNLRVKETPYTNDMYTFWRIRKESLQH